MLHSETIDAISIKTQAHKKLYKVLYFILSLVHLLACFHKDMGLEYIERRTEKVFQDVKLWLNESLIHLLKKACGKKS